jgi:hypothetical protein
MRKRLIEREVERRGKEAGLSMEVILMATSSLDESVERHQEGQARSIPSGRHGELAQESPNGQEIFLDSESICHQLKYHKDSQSVSPKEESIISRFTNWFGRTNGQQRSQHQQETTKEGRSAITLDSAPFHSSFLSRQGRASGDNVSLPSNAEVISVANDEEYRKSPTNWNEWDCPAAVKTPQTPGLSEHHKEIQLADYEDAVGQPNDKKRPAKFFSPMLRKTAQGVIRRMRRTNKETEPAAVPINHSNADDIDEHEYDDDINLDDRNDADRRNVTERPSDYENYFSDSGDGGSNKRKTKHRLIASSPHWVSDELDHATGFLHVSRDGDSISAASQEMTLTSFRATLQQRPPIPPSQGMNPTSNDVQTSAFGTTRGAMGENTHNDSSSAWNRPGLIATDQKGSTPLSRRLARQDPDGSRSAQSQQPQPLQGDDPQQQLASYPPSRSIRSELSLPPSGVRLIKKTSSLAKIRPASRAVAGRDRQPSNPNQGHDRPDDYEARVGATLMLGDVGTTLVEMNVEGNESAMILGSIDEDYGGMELEWGHTI